MNKKNTELSRLRQSQKDVHQEEISEIINDTYDRVDVKSKVKNYHRIKRMTWITWLVSVGIGLSLIGLSIGIGFIIKENIDLINAKKMGWNCSGLLSVVLAIVIFVTMFLLGYINNKNAASFYNDRRRRYQKTLTDQEAKIIKVRKILFVILLILIVFIIISFTI